MWSEVRTHSCEVRQILQRSKHLHSKWKKLNAFITECWEKAEEAAAALPNYPGK